jgi:hypothetical protein
MVERRRLGGGAPFPPGEYTATCTGAYHDTSAAGNKMVVWSLQLANGQFVRHWTVRRRVETGLMAQALGLPLKPLRIADALDRQCRATVAWDGSYMKVTGVRPV